MGSNGLKKFVGCFPSVTIRPFEVKSYGAHFAKLSLCNEKPRALEKILAHVEEKSGSTKVEVDMAIQDLENKIILYDERGKYLTLPHNSHL